jgi:hydroxymethylbilane synthase
MQVKEVQDEIVCVFPNIRFEPIWILTKGDCDKTTSLREMEKTDFFTDTIDQRQLEGEFRISVHSAKDLSDPLHPELEVVAVTKGVDSSDVLVAKQFPIPLGARVGTSSLRREAFLKQWRPDLICVDIRGTIDERLRLLDEGCVDGVVMAEAAIIRLKETHRPRMRLETEVAPLQGKLAVVALKGDVEMKQMFKSVDTR